MFPMNTKWVSRSSEQGQEWQENVLSLSSFEYEKIKIATKNWEDERKTKFPHTRKTRGKDTKWKNRLVCTFPDFVTLHYCFFPILKM